MDSSDRTQRKSDRDARDELASLRDEVARLTAHISSQEEHHIALIGQKDEEIKLLKVDLTNVRAELDECKLSHANETRDNNTLRDRLRNLPLEMDIVDEGINGKMEESNKRQKSFTLGDSRLGIQAGALTNRELALHQ